MHVTLAGLAAVVMVVAVATAALGPLPGASGAAVEVPAVIRNPKPAKGPSHPVPEYVVDLDMAPEERWTALVTAYAPKLYPILDYILDEVPEAARKELEAVLGDLDRVLMPPFAAEIRGAAAALNVSVGDLVAVNLYYEATSGCTSIVAQHTDDDGTGHIVHGRNLDYGLPDLMEVAVQLNFTRGGAMVYRGVSFVGYLGLLTGVRPGGFSVSINERRTEHGSVWTNIVEALLDGGKPIGFVVRETLEGKSNFAQALAVLRTQHLASVCYITVGGVGAGEGAVVTRDRNKAVNVRMLWGQGAWEFFVLETNYDWDKPVPPSDNRRGPAMALMNATSTGEVDAAYLRSVLSTFPVLNSETMYTTVMQAGAGGWARSESWNWGG